MAAFGYFLEILVWLLPWSIVATRFALSFNEPSARIGGMPGRVWAALLFAWSWLVTMLLWPGSGYASWQGALALLSAPLGALLEMLIVAHRRLRARQMRLLAIGAGVTSAILVLGLATFVLAQLWHSDDSGTISMAEFDSVKVGQSEASVLAQFGRAQTQYDTQARGISASATRSMTSR